MLLSVVTPRTIAWAGSETSRSVRWGPTQGRVPRCLSCAPQPANHPDEDAEAQQQNHEHLRRDPPINPTAELPRTSPESFHVWESQRGPKRSEGANTVPAGTSIRLTPRALHQARTRVKVLESSALRFSRSSCVSTTLADEGVAWRAASRSAKAVNPRFLSFLANAMAPYLPRPTPRPPAPALAPEPP